MSCTNTYSKQGIMVLWPDDLNPGDKVRIDDTAMFKKGTEMFKKGTESSVLHFSHVVNGKPNDFSIGIK